MKPYYELHITYLDTSTSMSPPVVEGWSHSVIAGDIILGEGRKQYLTHHAHRDEREVDLVADMEMIASGLAAQGKRILRTKVELVLYDHRTPR